MRQSIVGALAFVVLLCLGEAGCTTTEKIKVSKTGAPEYQQLHVVYDSKADDGPPRLDEPPTIRQTSAVAQSRDDCSWTKADFRLEIQYPCPGVHPAFARATLRVHPVDADNPKPAKKNSSWFGSSKKSPPPETKPAEPADGGKHVDEMLVLDLPRTELDAVLADLAHDGYFTRPNIVHGQSQLHIDCNKGQVQKRWNREPRLDAMIDLLRQHGTPVAIKPPAP